MGKFAIIIHPVNLDLLYIYDKGTRNKRIPLMKKILTWTPPFFAANIEGVKSITGKKAEGFFIMCPLLPEQILSMDQNFVLKRVIDAGKIAERMKANLIGLAAYTSLVGKRGALIGKNLKTPVTTGTSYTIVIAIQGILKAIDSAGMVPSEVTVAIIGATGCIGSICSQFLANKVGKIILVARNIQRLAALKSLISGSSDKVRVEISNEIDKATSVADVIVTTTNTPTVLINLDKVRSGTIICDISQPRNISKEQASLRNDILIIDGGVVQPPGKVNFNFNFGLTHGLAFACIAETMILALEEKYENFSLGGNISLSKVKKISELASKHGFKLANLRSFDKKVAPAQIQAVKMAFLARKSIKE